MQKLERIVGQASDPEIAGRLHGLQRAGRVEYLALQPEDMQRHRLRVTGDQGTEYAIAIPRRETLRDGAVLMLGEEKAVVVRSREQNWLRLKASDPDTALELGYFAGNMHWKVRFDGPVLEIALQGPEADYLTRLADFLADGRIERAP
jgi:urease accessory protein